MRIALLLLLLSLIAQADGQALADSTRAPRWSVRAQAFGMQGAISAGALWNIPDGRLQLGAMYGYGPARYGGQDYHGAILRTTGSWFPIHRPQFGNWNLSPIMSVSAAYEMSSITFFFLPDDYPKGYYGPQSLHGLLSFGGRLGQCSPSGGWSFTAEAVTLDTYLWYGIIQQQIEVRNMWNLALGAEYHF